MSTGNAVSTLPVDGTSKSGRNRIFDELPTQSHGKKTLKIVGLEIQSHS